MKPSIESLQNSKYSIKLNYRSLYFWIRAFMNAENTMRCLGRKGEKKLKRLN
jgi:hypothetical protein